MNDQQRSQTRGICVYYNSACPVCKAGIEYQKGKAQQADIFWGDIHLDKRLLENVSPDLDKLGLNNLSLETLRKYLHVTDQQGEVHIGIDAFIVIWRNSDKQVWLANMFSLPILKSIAKTGYFIFANILYHWNRWQKHW